MTLALSLAAAALAQEAPRYVAIFDLDRTGQVVAMTGCDAAGCFEIDLTDVRVWTDPRSGRVTLVVPQDDGTWSMESWDSCHYDYGNQMSVCDELVLPEDCECSEPPSWSGGGQQ